MSALKTGLAVALAALFSVACANAPQTTNQNRNTNAPAAAPSTPATDATANANQPAQPPSNIDAASIYMKEMCAGCHGTDGRGVMTNSRNFTDPAWQKSKTDDEIAASIRNGAPSKKMPAYKDKLTDAQIKALVAHIRSFGK
ncbi:MAG TPA: c-type cytochrome [Blastocatellia bacterium]|nr:c-type cytochrome [Blastocatellia bacterium]